MKAISSDFQTPQVILFVENVQKTSDFYKALGFKETFRVPKTGKLIHIDLELDGYKIGFASENSLSEDHQIFAQITGNRATIVLWTTDIEESSQKLIVLGAKLVKNPTTWLNHLKIAWFKDFDGHLIQLVQELSAEN